MKKSVFLLSVAAAMLSLSSCTDYADNPVGTKTETIVADNEEKPVLWAEDMETMVVGNLEDQGDMKAISLGFTNITKTLTPKTQVLILDDITDENIETLLTVLYDNEGFVFINNPEKANLDKYEDDLPFFTDQFDYNDLDLLGFCMEGAIFQNYVTDDEDLIVEPYEVTSEKKKDTGEETVQEVINYENQEEYNPVYDTEEWYSFQDATEWIDLVEEERESTSEVALSRRAALTRAAASRAVGQSVKDISTVQGVPYSTNFKVKLKFAFGSDVIHECYIMGDASYSIKPFYIYEGQQSAGDYYVVQAHYTWNNSSAYRACEFGWHGWNALGAVPLSCQFLTTPVMKSGYSCIIPVEGSVRPENVNKETKVTEERSFTLSAKGTIGTKSGVDDGKTKASASKGLEVSAEWGWKESTEYTRKTWDIYRIGGGNQAGHNIVLNKADLPERRTGVFRTGYNNVKHELLNSTFDVESSWIWYVPETKIDSDDVPLTIKCEFKPHYIFYLNGKFTSEEPEYHFYEDFPNLFTHEIKLLPSNRINAGILELKNTFDSFIISNVEITDASTGEVVAKSDATTIEKAGSMKFTLPATNRKYNITFKAGTTASGAKKYKNTDVITLAGLGDVTSFSSAYAFEEVKE